MIDADQREKFTNRLTHAIAAIKAFLLPWLVAIFPSLFHYANNAAIVLASSLARVLLFNTLLACVAYIVYFLLLRKKPIQAANATFVFLFFFNIYGPVYNYFLGLDVIQVEHYTLLPLLVLLAVYTSWLLSKINTANSLRFWNSMTLIMGVLVVFNIVKIIPAEIEKDKEPTTIAPVTLDPNESVDPGYPDIYYIVFDEFSGFEPMREYWQYEDMDDFVEFLKSQGFFVAENSHGSSIDTLHQMATRLNYQEYRLDPRSQKIWFDDIADNQTVRYLKSIGYTTVDFNEMKFAYKTIPPMKVDYSFSYEPGTAIDLRLLFDEFGILVADNSMLRTFSRVYKLDNPETAQHKNMVLFTANKIADLDEVPSPKFVYVHLVFPHWPFIFDGNGNLVDPEFFYDWNYYLGNYEYATLIAERMVNGILSQADPVRPPIIILQSDHGARNHIAQANEKTLLQNFPEEYKTWILFALHMPQCDYSAIPQDVDPINTFPIIFNCLFDANIPLR